MGAVRYLGWLRFRDSGSAYRKWSFEEDVVALHAAAGDELFDRGPGNGDTRFEVRRKGTAVLAFHDLETVEEALGFDLPPWRPPRDEMERMNTGLEDIAKAVRELARVRELEVAGRAAAGEGPAKDSTAVRANRFLRLKREGDYSNTGEHFQIWELLVDVPSVRLTERLDVPGKPYAQVGDELWEEDDDLTPFKLKREGKRIADPEWWQVRRLFVGLREDRRETEQEPTEASPAQRLVEVYERLVPGDDGKRGHLLFAERDVPGTVVRAGDYLVNAYLFKQRDPVIRGATQKRVPRAQLATVEAATGRQVAVLRVSFNPDYNTRDTMLEQFRESLRRSQSPKWSDRSSPLVIVRPLVAPVSEPIRAGSDDGALFELLSQVGGRMPSGG